MISAETRPHFTISGDKLSHAYIASGRLADELAMVAVCSGIGARPCMECAHCSKSSRGIHPDIAFVDKPKDKREIIIEQIRELKRDVIVVPNESEKKVYVINNADLMNINAQNAFLRILEEPPTHTVFILKTDTPAELLPTVRSRCIELKAICEELPPDAIAADTANAFFSALQRGNSALTAFMFQLDKLDKDQFAEFLMAARKQAASQLGASSSSVGVPMRELVSRAVQVLDIAGSFLDLNVSVGHISGMICANLIDISTGQ